MTIHTLHQLIKITLHFSTPSNPRAWLNSNRDHRHNSIKWEWTYLEKETPKTLENHKFCKQSKCWMKLSHIRATRINALNKWRRRESRGQTSTELLGLIVTPIPLRRPSRTFTRIWNRAIRFKWLWWRLLERWCPKQSKDRRQGEI